MRPRPSCYAPPLDFNRLLCRLQYMALRHGRAALESDWVSASLHNWIDLTFGYQLSGDAAVAAKNVPMPPASHHTLRLGSSRVQLFDAPHPHRSQEPDVAPEVEPSLVRFCLFASVSPRDVGAVHTLGCSSRME